MHDRFYTFTLECSSGNLTPAICQVTLDVNQPSQEQTPNDFFQVDDDGLLSLRNGVDRNAIHRVVIPDQINGIPVLGINVNAFYNCPSLISIDLGSATTIGNNAFQYCPSLTSIDLGSVTTIGSDAFRYCPSLTSITYNRTSIASSPNDLVLVNSVGNVVDNGSATITRNDGGFLTQ